MLTTPQFFIYVNSPQNSKVRGLLDYSLTQLRLQSNSKVTQLFKPKLWGTVISKRWAFSFPQSQHPWHTSLSHWFYVYNMPQSGPFILQDAPSLSPHRLSHQVPCSSFLTSLPGPLFAQHFSSFSTQQSEQLNMSSRHDLPLKALQWLHIPPGIKSKFLTMREYPKISCPASLFSLNLSFMSIYTAFQSFQQTSLASASGPGTCFSFWFEDSFPGSSRADSFSSPFRPQMSPLSKSSEACLSGSVG